MYNTLMVYFALLVIMVRLHFYSYLCSKSNEILFSHKETHTSFHLIFHVRQLFVSLILRVLGSRSYCDADH